MLRENKQINTKVNKHEQNTDILIQTYLSNLDNDEIKLQKRTANKCMW